MKRLLNILTVLMLTCILVIPISSCASSDYQADGDVNLDGTFNIADVVLFQRYLLAIDTLTKEQADNADCLNDGELNVFDLVMMRRMLIEKKEDNTMKQITVQVENQQFTAIIYENDTTKALLNRLPVTLDMNELNGNEKYFYLSESLPMDSERVGKINTGDIMLYGSECLVLFYDSFSTPYSYTRIGYIENPEELADAVGSENVTVTFSVK